MLAYWINANQIDRYYKQVAYDSAATFSLFVDGDYLAELRAAAESEEYQELIFKRADKAMYENKQQYKMNYGSYQ